MRDVAPRQARTASSGALMRRKGSPIVDWEPGPSTSCDRARGRSHEIFTTLVTSCSPVQLCANCGIASRLAAARGRWSPPSAGAGAAQPLGRGTFADQLAEHLDQLRVELRAGAATQLRQGILDGHRVLVGAIVEHRAKGVADRDDAGAERDLLAGQAVRVTLAVPALVAGAHERADPCQRRAGRGDDLLAHHGVLLHERPLAFAERAGSSDDLVGNAELADIVQVAGLDDQADGFLVEADRAREQLDVAGDVV